MRCFHCCIAPFAIFSATVAVANNSSYLQVTTLVTNAQNHSALQCWQFTNAVSVSSQAGTFGTATFAFDNATELVYTVILPRLNGGTHNAFLPQYVQSSAAKARP